MFKDLVSPRTYRMLITTMIYLIEDLGNTFYEALVLDAGSQVRGLGIWYTKHNYSLID